MIAALFLYQMLWIAALGALGMAMVVLTWLRGLL